MENLFRAENLDTFSYPGILLDSQGIIKHKNPLARIMLPKVRLYSNLRRYLPDSWQTISQSSGEGEQSMILKLENSPQFDSYTAAMVMPVGNGDILLTFPDFMRFSLADNFSDKQSALSGVISEQSVILEALTVSLRQMADKDDETARRAYISFIGKNFRRLRHINQSLGEFLHSSAPSSDYEETVLNPLRLLKKIHDTLQKVAPPAGYRVRLALPVQSEVLFVRAQPRRLAANLLTLLNIALKNAADHTVEIAAVYPESNCMTLSFTFKAHPHWLPFGGGHLDRLDYEIVKMYAERQGWDIALSVVRGIAALSVSIKSGQNTFRLSSTAEQTLTEDEIADLIRMYMED